jgi:hypothetical protein
MAGMFPLGLNIPTKLGMIITLKQASIIIFWTSIGAMSIPYIVAICMKQFGNIALLWSSLFGSIMTYILYEFSSIISKKYVKKEDSKEKELLLIE